MSAEFLSLLTQITYSVNAKDVFSGKQLTLFYLFIFKELLRNVWEFFSKKKKSEVGKQPHKFKKKDHLIDELPICST